MELIYKFPLYVTDYQVISLPQSARIIHAGIDGEKKPCIWAQVKPGEEKQDKKVWVIGTGSPLPEGANQHVGSFLYENKTMKHVFI